MLRLLARNWWTLALRGLVAIIFGLVAFIWTDIAITALALVFGAYFLIDGVLALIAAFKDRALYSQWWVVLLEGIAGVAVGILTFAWPDVTALVLLYLIAAWALVTGILEILIAIWLRRELEGEWLLILTGIASVAFALILFVQPGAGARALLWVIGAYAILFGVMLLFLAFRLRGWIKRNRLV